LVFNSNVDARRWLHVPIRGKHSWPFDQYEYLAEKRDALERWERELLRIVNAAE